MEMTIHWPRRQYSEHEYSRDDAREVPAGIYKDDAGATVVVTPDAFILLREDYGTISVEEDDIVWPIFSTPDGVTVVMTQC